MNISFYFRPPLPPKPRNIVSPSHQPQRTPSLSKSFFPPHIRTDNIDGGPPKWTGQEPETEASEKELIRELLYVFQVRTDLRALVRRVLVTSSFKLPTRTL